MHKTHIFDQKNIAKKNIFTDLPTLFFFGPLQETNNLFFRPNYAFVREISPIQSGLFQRLQTYMRTIDFTLEEQSLLYWPTKNKDMLYFW